MLRTAARCDAGAMQPNATSLLDGSPFATAIVVADTTDVSIEGLIVDGANNGLTQCSPRLFGIAFQNASGEISHVAIRNFKLGTGLGGCQSGGGGSSNVEIEKSSIHDFQKNEITANEVGTACRCRATSSRASDRPWERLRTASRLASAREARFRGTR